MFQKTDSQWQMRCLDWWLSSRRCKQQAYSRYWIFFYGNSDYRNVNHKLSGPLRTSQRAELAAALEALKRALIDKATELVIKTDSKHVVNCDTVLGKKWESNGYRNSRNKKIANSDLICVRKRSGWSIGWRRCLLRLTIVQIKHTFFFFFFFSIIFVSIYLYWVIIYISIWLENSYSCFMSKTLHLDTQW